MSDCLLARTRVQLIVTLRKELVGADIVHAVMLHIAGALVYLNVGTLNWILILLLLIGSLPEVLWAAS